MNATVVLGDHLYCGSCLAVVPHDDLAAGVCMVCGDLLGPPEQLAERTNE